jgi:hypothetical protein
MNATIIYVSSNREKPEFEQGIIDNVLANCGGLPIVSVTQKPIALGDNICVSDVGVSGFNMFRQVQIACEAAATRFVISAEADCLYPPDYFSWLPERDDLCYRNTNLYVMPQWRAFFWRKPEGATHAQVINREFYLRRLEFLFRDMRTWNPEQRNFPKEIGLGEDVFPPEQIAYYQTVNPVVQIKTDRSMRHYTHSERVDTPALPYWGDGQAFRTRWYR